MRENGSLSGSASQCESFQFSRDYGSKGAEWFDDDATGEARDATQGSHLNK
jgi:hypothetical protein